MEEIVRFVVLAQSDRFTVTELWEQFGISRKTQLQHVSGMLRCDRLSFLGFAQRALGTGPAVAG